MIYFIENGEDGHIKIGYARHPTRRLKELQTGSPYPLRLVCTIPGSMEKEKELHEQFRHCSGKGEWFAPCQDLLLFIESLKIPKVDTRIDRDSSSSEKENGLIGKFFHSFSEEGGILWQGQVVAKQDDYFIVQLYSWTDGMPTDQKLVQAKDMMSWNFYDSDKEMRYRGCILQGKSIEDFEAGERFIDFFRYD